MRIGVGVTIGVAVRIGVGVGFGVHARSCMLQGCGQASSGTYRYSLGTRREVQRGWVQRVTADLRCDGAGGFLQEPHDLRAVPTLGDVQRPAAILRWGRGGRRLRRPPQGKSWAGAVRRGEAARRLRMDPSPPLPCPSPRNPHASLLGPLRHRSPCP